MHDRQIFNNHQNTAIFTNNQNTANVLNLRFCRSDFMHYGSLNQNLSRNTIYTEHYTYNVQGHGQCMLQIRLRSLGK